MVAGLVDVFVLVVWTLFRQFLMSRFRVFVENFKFSIILLVIWGRKDAVNAKLL